MGASAICSYTTSGATAFRAARERPRVPILVLTSKIETARRLAILWGAHGVDTRDGTSFAEIVKRAVGVASRDGFATEGQRIIITAGVQGLIPGSGFRGQITEEP